MISDKDLHDIYMTGFANNHVEGLKAVWAAARAYVEPVAAAEPATPAVEPVIPTPPV